MVAYSQYSCWPYFGDSDYLLAVGCAWDDVQNSTPISKGAAYIYRNTGSGWTYQTKLVSSQAGDYERMGHTVAFIQDQLIVAGYQVRMQVYNYNSQSSWSENGMINHPTQSTNSYFGIGRLVQMNDLLFVGNTWWVYVYEKKWSIGFS